MQRKQYFILLSLVFSLLLALVVPTVVKAQDNTCTPRPDFFVGYRGTGENMAPVAVWSNYGLASYHTIYSPDHPLYAEVILDSCNNVVAQAGVTAVGSFDVNNAVAEMDRFNLLYNETLVNYSAADVRVQALEQENQELRAQISQLQSTDQVTTTVEGDGNQVLTPQGNSGFLTVPHRANSTPDWLWPAVLVVVVIVLGVAAAFGVRWYRSLEPAEGDPEVTEPVMPVADPANPTEPVVVEHRPVTRDDEEDES